MRRELVGLVTVERYARLTVLWNGAAVWDSSSHMRVNIIIIAMARDEWRCTHTMLFWWKVLPFILVVKLCLYDR